MEKLKKLYEELYQNGYHKNLGFSHSKNLIQNGIKTYLKKKDKVLDVGCSTGTALLILKENDFLAYGVDISETAVNEAKKNGADNCKVSQSHEIDYEDNFFNGILCTDVLEHVHENNIMKTFLEFDRLTTDNAYYFLKIALQPEKNRSWDSITKKYGYKDLHILVKNKKYWLDLFEGFELKIIKTLTSNDNTLEIILQK